MSSLGDAVAERCSSSGPLWFPGLAGELSAAWLTEIGNPAWDADYGTHRWLKHDLDASRQTAGCVKFGQRSAAVEILPEAQHAQFPGLSLARAPELASLVVLQQAADLFSAEPSLSGSVGALVRSVHLLEAEPDYDISHSEPSMPYSIFVSVPPPSARMAPLRLAESVLHESMHLQLTLMEAHAPLMTGVAEAFSPWQGRVRPASGLLHGLYVFAVIFQALPIVARALSGGEAFAEKRRRQIAAEVGALGDFSAGLTENGRALMRRCREVVSGG